MDLVKLAERTLERTCELHQKIYNKIHIPLPEDEAVRALLQVKPTTDMPRPGATGGKGASGHAKKVTKERRTR